MRRGKLGSRCAEGARLRFENLEDRTCLSVTVATVTVHGQEELRIIGDQDPNTVAIVDDGSGHLDVFDGDGNLLGSGDGIDRVRFVGKDGADVVSYTLTNPLTHNQSVLLDLGGGSGNLATLDLSPGVAGAHLNVVVIGGPADDMISATLGGVSDGHAAIILDGKAGDDVLSVLGTAVDISADAALAVVLDGGKGNDALTAQLDSQIQGRLTFDAWGGPGEDTLTSNLTVNPGSTGRLFARSAGGPGIDEVTLNIHDNSGDGEQSMLAAVHAAVFDPAGEDTLVHTDQVVELHRWHHLLGWHPPRHGGPGRWRI